MFCIVSDLPLVKYKYVRVLFPDIFFFQNVANKTPPRPPRRSTPQSPSVNGTIASAIMEPRRRKICNDGLNKSGSGGKKHRKKLYWYVRTCRCALTRTRAKRSSRRNKSLKKNISGRPHQKGQRCSLLTRQPGANTAHRSAFTPRPNRKIVCICLG